MADRDDEHAGRARKSADDEDEGAGEAQEEVSPDPCCLLAGICLREIHVTVTGGH